MTKLVPWVFGVMACMASVARADVSKAWAAAQANLPAKTGIVLAIDVGAIRQSPLFDKALAAFRASDRKIDQGYAMIKTTCGWDPLSAIDGVVIASDPHDGDDTVAYLQLNISRAKATRCFKSTLKMIARGRTVSVKQQGTYTVATVTKRRSESAYFPWVAPNVVMVSMAPDHKDRVDAWFGQKTFAKSPVHGGLRKLDPKATMFGLFASTTQVDRSLPVLRAWGNLTVSRKTVTGTLMAAATDAKAARKFVDEGNREIQRDLKRKRTPAAVKRVMRAISLTARGAQISLRGSIAVGVLGSAIDEFTGKVSSHDRVDAEQDRKIIAKFESFTNQMCRCKSKACADGVQKRMTAWGTKMAKTAQSSKPSPELAKQATEIMTRYAECMTKLMAPPNKP